MEHVSERDRVGMTEPSDVDEMLWGTIASAGNDRNADCVGDRAGQFDVESLAGAFTVDRSDQNLAGA